VPFKEVTIATGHLDW